MVKQDKIKEEVVLEAVRLLIRRQGKVTTNMVSRYMEKSPTLIRKHLNNLVKKELIDKLGKGKATFYSYK